jgi:hypothetical protein
MLQFYIKRWGKNVTAADSLEQLVCSDTKAVGTPGFCLPLWYVFNMVLKNLFLSYQPKEEAGSAGEQPASNKVDAITIKGSWFLSISSFYLLSGSCMA